MSIRYFTQNESALLGIDWPRPVNRKTSEDGVKKSFLFEPQAS